jgi:hypothetical protein
VKQGAIISPILFCIYLDGLLSKLRDSRVGCFVGDVFVGALAYADDLTLLSPTPSGIRQLLAVCESYAGEFDIVFNGTKSKCIFTAPTRYRDTIYGSNPQLTISGKDIEYVDQWPHLGHIITNSNDDEADITSRRNKLCSQINNVLCFFNRRCSTVRAKLLMSYCYSFYGAVLWDLSHPSIDSFCCAWRKGLRRALNLPADTSSSILPGLVGTLPILDELARRTTHFIQACLSSDSDTVRSIAHMAVFSLRMSSPLGRNAHFCCARFNATLDDIAKINRCVIEQCAGGQLNNDDCVRMELIRELLQVESGELVLSSLEFARSDVIDMVDALAHR